MDLKDKALLQNMNHTATPEKLILKRNCAWFLVLHGHNSEQDKCLFVENILVAEIPKAPPKCINTISARQRF
jgi:hypothetical protein